MARPVVDKVLAPVMIGGALGEGEWPLAIRFDIMQRSCRAAFALYFVVKAAKIVLSGQLLRKQDDQGRPTALVEQHDIWAAATPESQRLIGQFLGFMLAVSATCFSSLSLPRTMPLWLLPAWEPVALRCFAEGDVMCGV